MQTMPEMQNLPESISCPVFSQSSFDFPDQLLSCMQKYWVGPSRVFGDGLEILKRVFKAVCCR